jgi:hypothetical protein
MGSAAEGLGEGLMIWKVPVSQRPDLHYDDSINPEGILMTRHSVSAVLALTGLAAIWIAGAPVYATEQTPQKPGVRQADKSQEECIARRQREGLNIRFAVNRCVNPNN